MLCAFVGIICLIALLQQKSATQQVHHAGGFAGLQKLTGFPASGF